ncbi:MAG: SH3 domain-containing protein [Verrucomicrobiota bacterium]|nr:SH3 domain-containing protein [Verrucomicrobiota bacterium]
MKIRSAIYIFCLPLIALAAEVVKVREPRVNVRAQPSIFSEVITQVQQGEEVTVLEVIPVKKQKPGEPTNWARIKMPGNTPVWVFSSFIKDNSASVDKLNLRAGPGENYSVIGRLEKGAAVKPIRTVEEWTEIEAPDTAFAFIDATLLDLPAALLATDASTNGTPESVIPEPAHVATAKPFTPPAEEAVAQPTPTPAEAVEVKNDEPVAAKANDAPKVPEAAEKTAAPTATETAAATPATTAPAPTPETLPVIAAPATVPAVSDEPLPKRIIRREGIVRVTRFNIQAPSWYELESTDTGKTINYLHAEKSDIKLKDYKGQRVIVTGEELIDPRYPTRPVIEVEQLEMAP